MPLCSSAGRKERILTVTYTVAATRDMRARFVSFFGEKGAERLPFRTINSLCTAIIGYYLSRIGYRVLNSWYVIGILRFLSGRKDEHGR